jgi:phospholipid/cholesterol/gamma-HCH transport system substrate-binding protein
MEATPDRKIKMGIFVTVGLTFILISIMFLGGDKLVLTKKATIRAKFPHIQGLSVGSLVSLSGIAIGNVSETKLLSASEIEVRMRIDASFLDKIKKGSTAEIRTQGALGDKFIFIAPTEESESIAEGDFLETAISKDFMSTLMEKGDETKKVFEIISEVHLLLKTMNENNNLRNTIKNISEASNSFKGASQDIQSIVKNLKNENEKKFSSSMARLDSILAKIDKGEGTLGALINDRGLHDSLKNIVGGSDRKQNLKQIIRSSIEKSEK